MSKNDDNDAADERPGSRERLLQATLEIIDEYGMERATTRLIAERAEANLQLIQYYFGSKAGMIDEAQRFVVSEYQRQLDEAVAGADTLVEGLRAGILFTWRKAVHEPATVQPDLLLQYLRATQPAPDSHGEGGRTRPRTTQEHAADLIQSVADRTGERTRVPAAQLALLMASGMGGLILEYRMSGDAERVGAGVETFADLITSLVEPATEPETRS